MNLAVSLLNNFMIYKKKFPSLFKVRELCEDCSPLSLCSADVDGGNFVCLLVLALAFASCVCVARVNQPCDIQKKKTIHL